MDECDSNQHLLPPNPGPSYETMMLPAHDHNRTQAVPHVTGRNWGLEAGPGNTSVISCKAKVKILIFIHLLLIP